MIRRLSVIAAMLAAVSFVAAVGTSFAGSKQKRNPSNIGTLDTVVISNYGAGFSGSVSTYVKGSGQKAAPHLQVKGTNTGLGNSSGASHDSVQSVDGHIAVAVPIDNFGGIDFKGDISGCGPFGAGTLFGTGMVEIYSPGASGNSSPENIICSPGVAFGAPNITGVDFPGGVAFENPFDGVNPRHEILAVANNFPIVVAPDAGLGICAPPPAGGGASLGTVTEYDISTLGPGPGNNVVPFNNNPVSAINPFSGAGPAPQNATIGGCLTLMLGPEELTFDEFGDLFVVNNLGSLTAASAAAPRFVTIYAAGATGDAFPFLGVIGLQGPFTGCVGCPPLGIFKQPVGITVASAPDFIDSVMYVSDTGDNSIKVFKPFTNPNPDTFFNQGTLIATIQGGQTKLSSPMGLAVANDVLYVVNQTKNSLEMFTDIDAIPTDPTGASPPVDNIHPTLIVAGKPVKLNQPVGVAVFPQFTPSSTETVSAVGAP